MLRTRPWSRMPTRLDPSQKVDVVARPRRERSSHAVAALLALAAIVAAIVAARVSFLTGEASGKWQLALRTEVKRSAAVLEDVRYLYQTESSMATAIVEARIRQRELLAAATGQPAAVQAGAAAGGVRAGRPGRRLRTVVRARIRPGVCIARGWAGPGQAPGRPQGDEPGSRCPRPPPDRGGG